MGTGAGTEGALMCWCWRGSPACPEEPAPCPRCCRAPVRALSWGCSHGSARELLQHRALGLGSVRGGKPFLWLGAVSPNPLPSEPRPEEQSQEREFPNSISPCLRALPAPHQGSATARLCPPVPSCPTEPHQPEEEHLEALFQPFTIIRITTSSQEMLLRRRRSYSPGEGRHKGRSHRWVPPSCGVTPSTELPGPGTAEPPLLGHPRTRIL